MSAAQLAEAALLASLADETPEGRSIVALVRRDFDTVDDADASGGELVEFSASTRMSGLDLPGRRIRKGAGSAVAKWVHSTGAPATSEVTDELDALVDAGQPHRRHAAGGRRAGRDSDRARLLGVVHLKDIVKDGMRERFDEMRAMGIRTVMITGDNAVTAAAIAARRPASTTSSPRPRPRTSSC